MQINVPLSHLLLSKHNVRQSYEPGTVEQMWAAIKARGIMQSLGVLPTRKKGHYEVHYGGLRLAALNYGLEREEITADTEVPCIIRDKATAREDSLAENVVRFSMHPLDECVEFKNLVDAGQSVEAVSERFGTTVRHIQQRLRLATLLPDIADAYRQRRITLDQAQAYATTADHGIQAALWSRLSDYPARWPADAIRREIAASGVPATHRFALLVGREAYETAGGVVEDALFAEDVIYRDRDLLERLATEKMEQQAEAVRTEGGFAEVRVSRSVNDYPAYEEVSDLRRIEAVAVDLSDEDQARYDQLGERYRELTEEETRDEDELSDEERAELDAIQTEINALDEKGWAYPDDVIARAVAVLVVDAEGKVAPHFELYVAKAEPVIADTQTSGDDDGIDSPASLPVESTARKPFAEPAKLADELADQRKQILAAAISQAPDLAYDVISFVLTTSTLGGRSYSSTDVGINLTAAPASRLVYAAKFDDTSANRSLIDLRDRLEQDWTGEADLCARFLAFRALAPEAKAALLAYAVGQMFKPTVGKTPNSTHSSRFHELLGTLMGIETAEWWRPDAANYWFRVTKEHILSILDQFGGLELRSRYSSEKKAPLAQTMERLCTGQAIVEPDVAERAKTWVPSLMRFSFDLPDVVEVTEDVGHENDSHHDAGDDRPLDEDVDLPGQDAPDIGMTDEAEPLDQAA